MGIFWGRVSEVIYGEKGDIQIKFDSNKIVRVGWQVEVEKKQWAAQLQKGDVIKFTTTPQGSMRWAYRIMPSGPPDLVFGNPSAEAKEPAQRI